MDRVSQLQDWVDKTVQDFAKTIGALLPAAPPVALDPNVPVTFIPEEQQKALNDRQEAYIKDSTNNLMASVKTMEYLIDNLPGINMTEEQQLARLRELDEEGKAAGQELKDAVAEAEGLLEEIRDTIDFLATQRAAFDDYESERA